MQQTGRAFLRLANFKNLFARGVGTTVNSCKGHATLASYFVKLTVMKKRRYLKYWRYHERRQQKIFNSAYRRYWDKWARENLESIERQVWGYRPTNKTV